MGDTPRLYNPYADLHDNKFMNNNKHNNSIGYQLPQYPEFLFHEEAARQRRSWGENITYYTGCGYLGGALAGAGKGVVQGLSAREDGDSLKLRINRVLNASGQTGRRYGNRLGVLGLLYAGMESGVVGLRGTDDILNSIVAGLGTGALFKAASGPRSAALGGAIGGLAVGAVVAGKHALKRYVPI